MGVLCAEGGEAALADVGLYEEGRHPYDERLLVVLPKKPAGAEPRRVHFLSLRALGFSTL